MSLEALMKILSPPEEPCDTSSSDLWTQVEAELQLPMPADYRKFIERYGTGCIDDFLWVHTPFTKIPALQLQLRAAKDLDALRILKAECGDEEVPYPVFPEPGGLFPWGATDNGDMLCWLIKGPASRWTIAINESRGPMWEEYNCPMVVFLAKLLSKEIRSEILAEDFPSDSPRFRVVSSIPGE